LAATADAGTSYVPAVNAARIAATLSARTPPSAAVNATSLAALLTVALSLLNELSDDGPPLILSGDAGAAGVTPSIVFNPSKPLRMSIHPSPWFVYRQFY
jgi:hypothetical protein